MTTGKKVARKKLSLPELASKPENASKVCHIMGYSRQRLYEIQSNNSMFGTEVLVDRLPGPRDLYPNQADEAPVERILAYSLEYTTHSRVRVTQQLVLQGAQVSSGGVRGVRIRNRMLNRHERLLRLERHVRDNGIALNAD
jgi:hypothetical protein